MDYSSNTSEALLHLKLTLAQYPILASRIRARMREELFTRGVISTANFERRVLDNAIQSQKIEGINNPYGEETSDLWETRKSILREHLTDLLFNRHFSADLLETLINEVLGERGVSSEEMLLSINPELAPLDLVFEQALMIEKLPEPERSRFLAMRWELRHSGWRVTVLEIG